MTEQLIPAAHPASADLNSFLNPILTRWQNSPETSFGYLHVAGAWTEITSGTLAQRAARFAAVLKHAGVGSGDVVLIILRHDLDAYAAFLGAMLIGGIPSFLPYPNIKTDELLYWQQHRTVFAHVRAKAIIVFDALSDAVESSAREVGSAIIRQSSVDDVLPETEFTYGPDDAIALLQHSSGTTGLKKGVALSFGAIVRQLDAYSAALKFGDIQSQAIASWLPLYHDMGLVTSFLLPVWLGIPIVGIDPFDWVARPTLLFEAIERYRATHAWLPNFAFAHLARVTPRTARYDLSSLVALISCSEPCRAATFDAFSKRFHEFGIRGEMLQACYAMAETVFAVSQSKLGHIPRRIQIDGSHIAAGDAIRIAATSAQEITLLSNGNSIRGCAVGVMHNGNLTAERVIGELVVNADYMFDGYYKNAETTAVAFAQGWYRTGDVGFIDDDEIYVVGRLKDIIIVNGKNIFSHDVEAALSPITGLKAGRAVAFGYYSDRAGSEQLVVVAERDEAERAATDLIIEINKSVRESVGIGAGDIRLVPSGWLVKTTSGKVSRSENAKKYEREFRGA